MSRTEQSMSAKLRSSSSRKGMFAKQSSTTPQEHRFSCRSCLIFRKEPFLSAVISTLRSSTSALSRIPHNHSRDTSTSQKKACTRFTQATHREALESLQRHQKYPQLSPKRYGLSINSNLLRTCCDQARRKRLLPSFPTETSLTQTSSDLNRSSGC